MNIMLTNVNCTKDAVPQLNFSFLEQQPRKRPNFRLNN
jgi:hypothetical protein